MGGIEALQVTGLGGAWVAKIACKIARGVLDKRALCRPGHGKPLRDGSKVLSMRSPCRCSSVGRAAHS